MTVYVDNVRHPFGRMIMCHMWADMPEELHAMAASIGIARKWFQDSAYMAKVSWNHYDISLTKKAEAMARGAVLTDKYGPLDFQAQQEGNDELILRIALLRASWIDHPERRANG